MLSPALCLVLAAAALDAGAAAGPKAAFESARVPKPEQLFGRWMHQSSAADSPELRGLEWLEFSAAFQWQTGKAQVIARGKSADGSDMAVAVASEKAAGAVITRAGIEFDVRPNILSGLRYRFRCRATGPAARSDKLLCGVSAGEKPMGFVALRRTKESAGRAAKPSAPTVTFGAPSNSTPARAAGRSSDAQQLEGVRLFQKADYEGARTAWKECRRLDPRNAFCREQLERLDREYGPEP